MKNIEDLEKDKSLTFNMYDNIKTLQDKETILVTINMSFNQKTTIEALRHNFMIRAKENEVFKMYAHNDDEPNNNIDDVLMFTYMLENFVGFMLDDLKYSDDPKDIQFIQDVKDRFVYNESSEILNTISDRKFSEIVNGRFVNTKTIEIERVPSNLSMSLC